MLKLLRLTVSQKETVINIDHVVQIKQSATTDQTNLCEIITVNGVVRPEQSYDEVMRAIMAFNEPRPY